ncbi:hypothetical protein [Psychromonas aquimarina]|uniref:hypothetical protein n=1 Tax=Psychromonas aquimarina TaxID=444919 RepID=UPI0004169274|nr:hypothetical protein [Psychromonas aquimarina]
MATNKQDDKALAEDQAFIQSLYDDLSEHNGDYTAEQPSEQLDQSILAAAHKAVKARPTLHIEKTSSRQTSDKKQELNRPADKRKKIAWYYPAATAASFLLVGLIVNHQLSVPINPEYRAPLVSMDHITKAEQSESLAAPAAEMELDTFSDQEVLPAAAEQAFKEEMLIGESDDAFAESEQQLTASVEVPVSAYKKSMKSSPAQLQSKAEVAGEISAGAVLQSTEAEFAVAAAKPQPSIAAEKEAKADMLASNDLTTEMHKQMLAEQAQQQRRQAAKAKLAPAAKDRMLSKQTFKPPLFPAVLAYEEYKSLQEQSKQKTLYWQLQQETDSSYVIKLFKTEQTSVFYRLNKNSFQLDISSEDKKRPFAEITYTAEK